jgi:hypothetical protein
MLNLCRFYWTNSDLILYISGLGPLAFSHRILRYLQPNSSLFAFWESSGFGNPIHLFSYTIESSGLCVTQFIYFLPRTPQVSAT